VRGQEIATSRLRLSPIAVETCRAILAGDLSSLEPAAGWPHADTLDALRMAVDPDTKSHIWLVKLDGRVVGDCGTVGAVRASGDIEIGYGLAAEYRGQGYGTEVVEALSRWLLDQPGVSRVVAEVLAGNVPSRRALERAGFVLDRAEPHLVWYALSGSAAS